MPHRFRIRRISPESPSPSRIRSPPLARKRLSGGPLSVAFTSNGRSLGGTAGFRRRDGLPGRIPGTSQVYRSNVPLVAQEFCFATRSALPGSAFASPVDNAPPTKTPKRPVRTAGPAVLKAFTSILGGSPRPFGQAVPALQGGPHLSTNPFGLWSGRRLSTLLQSGIFPGSDYPLERPFGCTGGILSRQSFPAFIEWWSGLFHQPDASVRVAFR
jgi:hypothetical protein